MANVITATITAVLSRAPEWIRADFGAKDPKARARAEEALAAMIEAALLPGTPQRKSANVRAIAYGSA